MLGGVNIRKAQIYIKKTLKDSKNYTESGGGVSSPNCVWGRGSIPPREGVQISLIPPYVYRLLCW